MHDQTYVLAGRVIETALLVSASAMPASLVGSHDGLMPTSDHVKAGVAVESQPEAMLRTAVMPMERVGSVDRDPASGSVTMIGVEQLDASSATRCKGVEARARTGMQKRSRD